MLNIKSPIIIIGAGRSGSTLLSALLNAHPEISYFSETGFLVPHIWGKIFEEHNLIMACLGSWKNSQKIDLETFRRQERQRINDLIARFCIDIMRINKESNFWGYKEIWNGSSYFKVYDWKIYHEVFPDAKWIQIVRNPIDFVASSISFAQQQPSYTNVIDRLKNWIKIVNYNTFNESKRYFALRYEDLIEEPELELRALFALIDVPWSEACLNALSRKYVPSKDIAGDIIAILRQQKLKLTGFYELCEKYSYAGNIFSRGIDLIDDRFVP